MYGDAKLGGGGAAPSSVCDGADRVTRRDLLLVAQQGALSSGQGQSPTRAVLGKVS